MFALIETALVFLGVVLLGAALPAAWFRRKFVTLSTIVVFIASVWFIFLHYNTQIIDQRQLVPALIWSGSLVLFITLVSVAALRSMRVELAIDAFVKRLAVLSFIYLFIDALSVILVIIRNI